MDPLYIPLPTPFVRYDKTSGNIFTHIGTLVCRKEACIEEKSPMYLEQLYRLVQQDGMLVDSDILTGFEVDTRYPILGIAGDTLPATNKFILRYAYNFYFSCVDMAKEDSFDLAIAPTAKDLAIHKMGLNMYPATEQYELRLIAKATGKNKICFEADDDSDLPFRHPFETDGNTPKKNEEIIAGRIFREIELILSPFAGRLHKKIKIKTKLTKVTSTFDFPSWFDNKSIVKKLLNCKSNKIEFVDT